MIICRFLFKKRMQALESEKYMYRMRPFPLIFDLASNQGLVSFWNINEDATVPIILLISSKSQNILCKPIYESPVELQLAKS